MATENLQATIEVKVESKAANTELERLRSPMGVKMTMDVSDAKFKLKSLRDEYKAMTTEMKMSDAGSALASSIEQQQRAVTILWKKLNNFVRTWDTELSAFAQSFQKLWVDINTGLWSKLDSLASSVKQTFSVMATSAWEASTNMAAALGWGSKGWIVWLVAAAAGAIGAWSLGLWDKYEQASISFNTMLGSAEKWQEMLRQLTEFAQKTPFELQWIRDSAKQLMAMGIEAWDMIPTLKALGDASAATWAPLQQIAYAYGQIKTAGAATTQDLNQLATAGIPIWDELGKVVGRTAWEVKKMVEDRQITFDQVQQALTNLTSEWGKFANMMAAQSETLSGKWAQFTDSLAAIWEKIWMFLIPLAKEFVDAMSWAVDWTIEVFWYLMPMFEEIWSFFDNIISGIQASWENMFGSANQSASDSATQQVWFWQQVWEALFMLYNVIVSVFSQIWETISGYLDTIWAYMTNQWDVTTNTLKTAFSTAVSAIANSILDIVNSAVNGIVWLANKGIDAINSLIDLANTVPWISLWKLSGFSGVNFSVWNWKWIFDTVVDKYKSTGKSLAAWISNFLGWIDKKIQARTDSYVNSLAKAGSQATGVELPGSVVAPVWGGWAGWKKKWGWGGWKWKDPKEEELKKQKELEKEKEKQEKESKDRQKNFFKEIQNQRKEEGKNIDEHIKKVKDWLKKLKDLEEELLKLNKEYTADVQNKYADQYSQVLESIKEAEKQIKEAQAGFYGDDWVEAAKNLSKYTEELAKLQAQKDELIASWNLTKDAQSTADTRSSLEWADLSKFDFELELKKLEEQKKLKEEEFLQKQKDIEAELGMNKMQAEKELEIATLRKEQNEAAIKALSDVVEMYENKITSYTDSEITKRMRLYNSEEARLRQLIALRMQAWYTVGAFPNATITNNNQTSTNVNVNANVSNNVDMNKLANTLAQKVQLSSKWIN